MTTRKSTINRVVKFVLTMYGVWPDTTCVTLCRVFWSITITVIQFCHYRYILTHFHSSDMFDLVDSFSSFIGYTKLYTKIGAFWLNRRIFDKILKMMAEDWSANSAVEIRETTSKAKTSDCINNAIITLHTFTILLYGIGIILNDVDVTDRTTEIPHIHKMDVPFVIHTQRTYRFVLIAELTYVFVCGQAVAIFNALLITLTLHAGGQIDILRCWLMQLVADESGSKGESVVSITRKIIQKHQRIIRFSENIESLYSFIALVHFATNVMMITLLGFLIVTSLNSPDATDKMVRSLAYYSATNLEAFMFCYAGEYLINKSKAIGHAAYDIAWYDMQPKHCRILLFIMLRSQKQLTLTVGKLTNLSLQCFASIMNSALSYMSVLLAMQ